VAVAGVLGLMAALLLPRRVKAQPTT
jgi:hypothetical protein